MTNDFIRCEMCSDQHASHAIPNGISDNGEQQYLYLCADCHQEGLFGPFYIDDDDDTEWYDDDDIEWCDDCHLFEATHNRDTLLLCWYCAAKYDDYDPASQ